MILYLVLAYLYICASIMYVLYTIRARCLIERESLRDLVVNYWLLLAAPILTPMLLVIQLCESIKKAW